MPPLMYQCPLTGKNVQVWYEVNDDPSDGADGFFETVICNACGQVHSVDPKTAKVVGAGTK